MRLQERASARPHGFALTEAAALLVVAAFVIAFILIVGNEQRRQGRLGEDIGKLRTLGTMTTAYTADNGDKFWSYSWKKGQNLSQWPDLNNAATDQMAAANQFADILRRRTGRLEITGLILFYPHLRYSNVVLEDHAGLVPDLLFVSAGDKHQIDAARDPVGYDAGLYPPGGGSGTWQTFPYGASFLLPTAFFDQSPPSSRVRQGSRHNQYLIPAGSQLGAHTGPEVEFPSAKVLLHDAHARHFGTKMPYCTHDEARLPLLFVDSSVSVRSAQEANSGWQVNTPASLSPTQFVYEPNSWEPPTFSGLLQDSVIGRFRWTRGTATEHGLVGRDFGGPETCSGQPGCP